MSRPRLLVAVFVNIARGDLVDEAALIEPANCLNPSVLEHRNPEVKP